MKVDFRGKHVCALSYSNGKVLGRYFKNESYSTLFNNRISQYKATAHQCKSVQHKSSEQLRNNRDENKVNLSRKTHIQVTYHYQESILQKTLLIFCA